MTSAEEQHGNSNEKPHKAPWLKQYEFKKGQSGNPGGRPKGVSLQSALRERLAAGESGDKLVESLVNVALREALRGDFRFWNSIIERVDGKVADRLAGPEGEGLMVILERAKDGAGDSTQTAPEAG